MPDPIFVLDIGPDGVVATHPARVELPKLVAPVPEDRVVVELSPYDLTRGRIVFRYR